jgi:hypothetical protein
MPAYKTNILWSYHFRHHLHCPFFPSILCVITLSLSLTTVGDSVCDRLFHWAKIHSAPVHNTGRSVDTLWQFTLCVLWLPSPPLQLLNVRSFSLVVDSWVFTIQPPIDFSRFEVITDIFNHRKLWSCSLCYHLWFRWEVCPAACSRCHANVATCSGLQRAPSNPSPSVDPSPVSISSPVPHASVLAVGPCDTPTSAASATLKCTSRELHRYLGFCTVAD